MRLHHRLHLTTIASTMACSMVLVACDQTNGNQISNIQTNGAQISSIQTNGAQISSIQTNGDQISGGFFNPDEGVSFARNISGNLADATRVLVSTSTTWFDDLISSGAILTSNGDTVTEACDSGTVAYTIELSPSFTVNDGSIVYDNCEFLGETTNGSLTFSSSESGNARTLVVNFNNVVTQGPETQLMFNGELNMSFTGALSTFITGSPLTLTVNDERFEFSDYSLVSDFDVVTEVQSFGGETTLTTDAEGVLTLVIEPAFVITPDNDFPTSGIAMLAHADGSRLQINAETGNPETYQFSIESGGAVTTGIGNWADENIELPSFGL